MRRLALVVPATTYRASDFLEAAERAGSEVVVVSDQQQALASVMGDRALRVDLRRPEAAARRLADQASRVRLDAIVGVDDRGVEVAALAAELLGLAHSPAEAVAATRDKAKARDLLEGAAGVRQPNWRPVTTPGEARAAAREIGLPVVVKPVSLSASRGVIRADSEDSAEAAARRTLGILDEAREARHLLVERYVAGAEVAVEGLVRAGDLKVLALFDKPDPMEGPHFEETLYVTPSRLPAGTQDAVSDAAQAAVRALGLTEGPVHAEFRVDGDDVWTLEVAARTIGGLCGRALRFGLGMSLEEVVIRHALGLRLHALAREDAAAGVLMLPTEREGRLREVAGVGEARRLPGIVGVDITVPAGHWVRPLPESDRYLGFAFARGHTAEEVEAALRRARAVLRARIDEAPEHAEDGDGGTERPAGSTEGPASIPERPTGSTEGPDDATNAEDDAVATVDRCASD